MISDVFGYCSMFFWLGAQFPQLLVNYNNQSVEGLALPFLANWFLGDASNLIGCLLTKQLPFQTYLATYFCLVDICLVTQFIYYTPRKPTSLPLHQTAPSSPRLARSQSLSKAHQRYDTVASYRTGSLQAMHQAASNMAVAAASELDSPSRRALLGEAVRAEGSQYVQRRSQSQVDADMDQPSSPTDGTGRRRNVSWSPEAQRLYNSQTIPTRRPLPQANPYAYVSGRGRPLTRSPGSATETLPNVDLTLSESALSPRQPLGASTMMTQSQLLPPADITGSVRHKRTKSMTNAKASRRSASIVFLGVWALFSVGPRLVSHSAGNGFAHPSSTNIGYVLDTPNTSTTPATLPFTAFDTLPRVPRPIFTPPRLRHIRSHVSSSTHHDHESKHPPPPPPRRTWDKHAIGRISAWTCTTLYLTSRLPQIWKNYVRGSVEGLAISLFVCAFLGNVFYVSSVLTAPIMSAPPPISTDYIHESIPYLLGSGGTLMFDITIVIQSILYRGRSPVRKGGKRRRTATVPREGALLAGEDEAQAEGADLLREDAGEGEVEQQQQFAWPSYGTA